MEAKPHLAPSSLARVSSRPEPLCWSRLYRFRRQAAARFGKRVFQLPLARRARDVLLEKLRDGMRVLEVGAGDRRMRGEILRRFPGVAYHSMDIDRLGAHDFYSLEEIRGEYDVVFAFEVIEHLPLEEIPAWLGRLGELLAPEGRLLLSTPNTFYPPAYLRDATHRTPLCYDELAGLVMASGLEVEALLRTYNDPLHRKLLRRYLFGWLFRLIGIDFAPQIVLLARRSTLGERRT